MRDTQVCGGGSTAPGLNQRLFRELRLLLPPSVQPQMCSVPDYMPDTAAACAAWMGGAVLSKVVFAQNQQITKAEYDEYGPSIVHKKCC